MIDLRKFFLDNVCKDDYYWRFRPLVQNIYTYNNIFNGPMDVPEAKRCVFEVFDEQEAVAKFRALCLPENEPVRDEDKCWFVTVAFYLDWRGYYIDEFPCVLKRPPLEPRTFTYDEIRQKAFVDGLNDGATVTYATRRSIVYGMTFTKKHSAICVGDDLDRQIKLISSRNAAFDEMVTDEKLEMLANLIESLLKTDGKFRDVDYESIMFDFVEGDDVKRYRGMLQCFRHSSEESIAQRAAFTEWQKAFLIDYGVTVCKALRILVQG